MRHHLPRRLPLALAFAAALLIPSAGTAGARPDPGEPTASRDKPFCPVERIGRQIVRCDDLSGNGVLAPLTLPQR